jgi:hypothetical protein
MTLKTRRLIFYSLIIIFLILAFIIIPYSNGLRFDIRTLSFVKLGGLYLETEPIDAQINVDNIGMQIKPGFLKSGILIANLFPKTYRISVTKQGYQPWSKNIEVKPSLVTQVHQIILLPLKWQEEVVAKNVKDIFLNSNNIAWKNLDDKLEIDGLPGQGKIIKGSQFITWLSNNKSVLTLDDSVNNYFTVNVSDNTSLNINLIFENLKDQKLINDPSKINKIIAYPSDGNKIILATDKSLYVLDFNKFSLTAIKSGRYNLLIAGNGKIFFADSENLYSYDLKSKAIFIITQKNASSAELSPNGQFLAFSSENKLFLLDQNNSEGRIKELSENPSYFKFSPDSNKIAVLANNSWWINIYFIGDDYELYGKKPMSSSSFEIGTLDDTSPITWHENSSYIFLKYSNSLNLLEIDDNNPPTNTQSVEINVNKYFYDQETNTIYLLRGDVLYKASE